MDRLILFYIMGYYVALIFRLCYVAFFYDTLRYAVSCYIILCYAMLRWSILCHVLLRRAILCSLPVYNFDIATYGIVSRWLRGLLLCYPFQGTLTPF